MCFFFQAEDGIRDRDVTGVQTCALPLLMGPEKESSTEKAEDPMELRIYRGADGDFTLYEDENDGYNCEKCVHATIPFHWDEAKQALTIGERKGDFPRMLAVRGFQIVFVGENHGVGTLSENKPDHMVQYSGKQITVTR